MFAIDRRLLRGSSRQILSLKRATWIQFDDFHALVGVVFVSVFGLLNASSGMASECPKVASADSRMHPSWVFTILHQRVPFGFFRFQHRPDPKSFRGVDLAVGREQEQEQILSLV